MDISSEQKLVHGYFHPFLGKCSHGFKIETDQILQWLKWTEITKKFTRLVIYWQYQLILIFSFYIFLLVNFSSSKETQILSSQHTNTFSLDELFMFSILIFMSNMNEIIFYIINCVERECSLPYSAILVISFRVLFLPSGIVSTMEWAKCKMLKIMSNNIKQKEPEKMNCLSNLHIYIHRFFIFPQDLQICGPGHIFNKLQYKKNN